MSRPSRIAMPPNGPVQRANEPYTPGDEEGPSKTSEFVKKLYSCADRLRT